MYYGGCDGIVPHYEQNYGLWGTWHFRPHFYEQIVEYFKSYVDEVVAVYKESDEVDGEVDEEIWLILKSKVNSYMLIIV